MRQRNAVELFSVIAVVFLRFAFTDGAEASCKDVNGLTYESGSHYIPGPDPCTLCICENGNPKWCKAVYCRSMNFSQFKDHETMMSKDCKTFRFGNACCELICMDDTLTNKQKDLDLLDEHADVGLRLIASCISALLSLSILVFLLYRLKKRKIRGRPNRQLSEEQRSLGTLGYLERSDLQHVLPLDDGPCNGGYPLWKPPSNYFPRGEAPPPYEEAVAAARAEQTLLSINHPHTINSLSFPPSSYLTPQHAHGISIVTNAQNGLPASSPALPTTNDGSTAPLIATNTRPLSTPAVHSNFYQFSHADMNGYCPGNCVNYVASSNTYENIPAHINRNPGLSNSASSIGSQRAINTQNNQILMPNPPKRCPSNSYPQHTTLPRQSGAFTISATLPTSHSGVHRSIPKTLSSSGSLRLRRDYPNQQVVPNLFNNSTLQPKNPKEKSPSPKPTNNSSNSVLPKLPNKDDKSKVKKCKSRSMGASPSSLSQSDGFKPSDIPKPLLNFRPPLASANEMNEDGSFDSVTCTCNAQAIPPLHDDADDYHSECENCKSATGSRYYLDNENEMVTSPHETMTLQRRPEEAVSSTTPQYYRTSLTLPTSTRQKNSAIRGKWFSAMPSSSTESSDGD